MTGSPGGPGETDAAEFAQEDSTREGSDSAQSSLPSVITRRGPGVPAPSPADQPEPGGEEVLRAASPPRPRRAWRLAGTVLTVALLVASAAVIYLRLHHGPLAVTKVAISRQVKAGCTMNVTGLISTSGGAGTISYQWVLSAQPSPAQALSVPVPGGKSGAYVSVAIEGQGHGSLAQSVTLRVLGPGHGSASARVVINC
jgi:hypothetical protein